MKLLKINIESYFHLENLSFDFTYPEGHEKAGKPLDKICIIGQSATGKTSTLEMIKKAISEIESQQLISNSHLFIRNNLTGFELKGYLNFEVCGEALKISDTGITMGTREFTHLNGAGSGELTKLIDKGIKLVYLSSDIISKEAISFLNESPINIANDNRTTDILHYLKSESYIYNFNEIETKKAWYIFLYEIIEYRKRFTQMASELINKGIIGDREKLNSEFDKWAKKNKNPLEKFANYFNPILKKLNLEVDLVNTEYSIPIKSKVNQEIIPIENLSTGTKGLLLSMFPLYELDTNDAIILIDEPERSLFPDMQIDLIENYKKIAPNAQIIVATHSPFIAASFEPEERFILYFNENGKVEVRPGKSPIGDDPNDILKNDFNVDYYNRFGQEAYKRYVSLKEQMANENDSKKKKQLLKEVTNLGDEYKF
jgi:GTPase SAR1 family protein